MKKKSLKKISIDELASAFDDMGFELTMDKRIPYNLTPEEAIIASLLQTEEPRLHEGIPVVLTKNPINYDKLKRLVDNYKLWNEFGYLGEFTSRHTHNTKIKELVKYCKKRLKPKGDLSGIFYNSAKRFQSTEEKGWKIIGGTPYREMDKQYQRYCHG